MRSDRKRLVEPPNRLPFAHRAPLPHLLRTSNPAAPSLAIVLLSVVIGPSLSVLGFYLAYITGGLSLSWSSAIGVLCLTAGVSGVAAGLAALYDRRTVGIHVGFGCALMFLLIAFAGFCLVTGALGALLYGRLGG